MAHGSSSAGQEISQARDDRRKTLAAVEQRAKPRHVQLLLSSRIRQGDPLAGRPTPSATFTDPHRCRPPNTCRFQGVAAVKSGQHAPRFREISVRAELELISPFLDITEQV